MWLGVRNTYSTQTHSLIHSPQYKLLSSTATATAAWQWWGNLNAINACLNDQRRLVLLLLLVLLRFLVLLTVKAAVLQVVSLVKDFFSLFFSLFLSCMHHQQQQLYCLQAAEAFECSDARWNISFCFVILQSKEAWFSAAADSKVQLFSFGWT